MIVSTVWKLDDDELHYIAQILGQDGLGDGPIEAIRRYGASEPEWNVPIQYQAVVSHLVAQFELNKTERAAVAEARTTDQLREKLESLPEPTERHKALLAHINQLPGKNAKGAIRDFLKERLPTFMYFSHYDRMSGEIRVDNIDVRDGDFVRPRQIPAYRTPQGHNVPAQSVEEPLSTGELVFLDFLEFAGTSVEEIKGSHTYESLNARCEAASNAITDQLREYWTQNPFLEIEVRVTRAEPKDPPPVNEGTIARARVRNTLHRVSVPFTERSAGFIWFFSFLVKFAQVRKKGDDIVILLDEPGLTLHGKAQADLLRYFGDKITPEHQLLFTTHSPFRVPHQDLTLSRIVEDQLEQQRPGSWTTKGTKVRDDVLATDPDTIFPLQGALGYDVTQTLFVGRNTLLVEGPADILFLNAFSAQLRRRKRNALDPKWTICPAGGIDKIQSFVSLFAGANLDIVVVTDSAAGDRKKLDRLKRSRILSESRIMNYAELLDLTEADVEDIFTPELYLLIVNKAFELKGGSKLTPAKLDATAPEVTRLVKRVEAAFRVLPADAPEFDHFTPADWLFRNPDVLEAESTEVEQTLENAEKVIVAINRHLSD